MDDHIDQLRRRIRRWQLISLVLGIMLVCSVVVGGTVNLLLMLEMPGQRELMMRAEEERDRAEVERAHAEKVRREFEAKKNGENGP